MLTINKLLAQGAGLSAVLLKRCATVQLGWDLRQKSHFEATDSQERALGIFLAHGTVVRGGDVLVADDGSLILVQAAPQPVWVVTHEPEHGSPLDLLRAAYHLGHRHVALELQGDHIKLEADPVLADLLRQMHLIVHERVAAFEPESNAYAASGQGSANPASATQPIAIAIQAAAHVHGPGCKHGHDHPH